jgi:serine protease Do
LSTSVVAQDPAQLLESTLTKVIEQSEPSVVSIARVRPAPIEAPHFFQRPLEAPQVPMPPSGPSAANDPENPDFQPNSYGTGIIIASPRSNERFVLTNYHVVHGGPVYPSFDAGPAEDSVKLFVRFADRRCCYGAIIAADPRSDLAVLRLELKPADIDEGDLKPIDWTASTPVRKGQLVLMLGNPYSLAHDGSASASWGMISNLARRPLPWTDDRASRYMMYRLGNLIQIDGRLNLGTSGGPLLNLKGELIGLTTSLATIEGYEKSSGFAIPLDDLTRRIVKSLVAGQEVEYGMLGIEPNDVTPSEFRALRTGLKQASAAMVHGVTMDSPAFRAGIKVGDVLLSVADIPIYSDYDLMRVVGLHAPESEVDVVLWRKHHVRPITVKVTLGKWPVLEEERIIETSPRFPNWRGLSVDYPTGRNKFTPQPPRPSPRAVVITKIVPDSVAARTDGLQPGVFITEVNRIPVQTPAEFHEATKSLRGPIELRLYDELRLNDSRKLVIGE